MRIVITGAGGLLGGRLSTLLAPSHEITGLVRDRPGPAGIPSRFVELTDAAAVAAVLRGSGAQTVVHCAGLPNPDTCEREPERSMRENEAATRVVAEACRSLGARLIFISTDLVFPGDAPLWSEMSRAAPLMEYGRAKLRAEGVVESAIPNAVILRTALIYGLGNGARWSASETIAQSLRRGEPVTLFEDEWRTPIDPESIVQAIEALLLRPEAAGRFHLGGPERLSRFELGERVASLLRLDASLLRRATQLSHPGAPRPRDVSLDASRARAELGWEPRPVDTAIRSGRLA